MAALPGFVFYWGKHCSVLLQVCFCEMFFKTLCSIFEVWSKLKLVGAMSVSSAGQGGPDAGKNSLWQGPVLAQGVLLCKQPARSLWGKFLHEWKHICRVKQLVLGTQNPPSMPKRFCADWLSWSVWPSAAGTAASFLDFIVLSSRNPVLVLPDPTAMHTGVQESGEDADSRFRSLCQTWTVVLLIETPLMYQYLCPQQKNNINHGSLMQ